MPARNTPVQLLALYTNPESHSAQRHRQTDGRTDGRTDRRQDYANSRSYYVVVRSAINGCTSNSQVHGRVCLIMQSTLNPDA